MNLKSLSSSITPVDITTRADAAADVRRSSAQSSADRDADGRQSRDDQKPKRPLTDDEFNEILAKIKELPGIKASNLTVKVVELHNEKWIHIEDASGQVVRRLSQSDLWSFYFSSGRTTGQLFDKAA